MWSTEESRASKGRHRSIWRANTDGWKRTRNASWCNAQAVPIFLQHIEYTDTESSHRLPLRRREFPVERDQYGVARGRYGTADEPTPNRCSVIHDENPGISQARIVVRQRSTVMVMTIRQSESPARHTEFHVVAVREGTRISRWPIPTLGIVSARR